MAIVQTGTALTFTALGTANTGTVSTTITVPADAEMVVVGWSGFSSTSDFFSGGSMTFTKGAVDTAMVAVAGPSSSANWSGGMFYLVLPDTGTNKTLKWDWLGTGVSSDPSTLCSVTFWKGVDTASPARGTGYGTNTGVPYTTGTITASSGDLFIAWCPFFVTAEGTIDSWSNLSLLTQLGFSSNADAAWATGSPTTSVTVAASTATGASDGSLYCVAFKAAAAGGGVPLMGQIWL